MKKTIVNEETLRLAIRKKLEFDLLNEAGVLPKAPSAVSKPSQSGTIPATSASQTAGAKTPPTDLKLAGIGLPFSAGIDDKTFNPIDPNVSELVDILSNNPQWIDTFGQITGYDLDQSDNVGLGLSGTYTDASKGPVPNIVLQKIAQLLLAGDSIVVKRKGKQPLEISPKLTIPAYIVLKAEDGTGSVLYAKSPTEAVNLSKIKSLYDPKKSGDLAEKSYKDLFSRKDVSAQLDILKNPKTGLKQSDEFGGTLRFIYIDGDTRPAENILENINGLKDSPIAQAVIDEVKSDAFEEAFLTALERLSWTKIPGENPYTQLYKAYSEFHRIVSRDKKLGALAIISQWSLYAGSLSAQADYSEGKLTQLRENRRIRRLTRKKNVRLSERQLRAIIKNAIHLLSEASPVKAGTEGGEGAVSQILKARRERQAASAAMDAEAKLGLNVFPETAESIGSTIKAAVGDAKISTSVAQSLQRLEKNILEATRSTIPDLIINNAALRNAIIDLALPSYANKSEREVMSCLLQLHVGLGQGSSRANMTVTKASILERLEELRAGELTSGDFINSAADAPASEQMAAFKKISSDFNLGNYAPGNVPTKLTTNPDIIKAVNQALGDDTNPLAPFTQFFTNNTTLRDVGVIRFDSGTNRWKAVTSGAYASKLSIAQSALDDANNLPVISSGTTPPPGAVTAEEKARRVAAAASTLESLQQGPRLLQKITEGLNTNTLAQEAFAGSVTTLLRRASIDADLMSSYSPKKLAMLMDKGIMNPRTGLARAFEELMSLKGTGEFSEEYRAVHPGLNNKTARLATVLILGGPTGWLNKIVTRKYIGEPLEQWGKAMQYYSEAVSSPVASVLMNSLGSIAAAGGRTGTATMFLWSCLVMVFGPTIVAGIVNEEDAPFIKFLFDSAASDLPGRPDPSALVSATLQLAARWTATVDDDDIAAIMYYANALDNQLAFKEYLSGRANRQTPFYSDAAIHFTVKNQNNTLQQFSAKVSELQGKIADSIDEDVNKDELRKISDELRSLTDLTVAAAETDSAAVYFNTLEKSAHDIFDEMLACISSINKQTAEIYVPKAPTAFSILDASRGTLTLTSEKEDDLSDGWAVKLLQKVNLIDERYQDSFRSGIMGILENDNSEGGESWRPFGISRRAEKTIEFLEELQTMTPAPAAAPGTEGL